MTPAETEEQAELEALRQQAGQTGRQAAQTLAELSARFSQVNDPRAMARRLAARTRSRGRAAVKRAAVTVVPADRAVARASAAAVPVLAVLALAIVAHRRGWLPPNSLVRNGRVLRPTRLPSPVPGSGPAGSLTRSACRR